jgi:UDP-glucose 4-epimerase
MARTALVTGGAGFIGSHVCRELVSKGFEVVAVDDLSGGFEDNLDENTTLEVGDVTDSGFVTDLFSTHEFECVFHLAAYAAEGLSHFIRRFNYTNNVLGSVNLINEAIKHDVRRFVFTSSIAVYGAGQTPMSEEMMPQPEDPYGIAKLAVEMDLRAAHEMFGLDYTIFRPHNVYGENQNIGDRYRNVVGIFMNKAMLGEAMPIFGDGLQTRAFSYISDVAPLIANSVDEEGAANQVFNVGADTPHSVLHLAHVVARAMNVEPEIIHLEPRNEVRDAFSDHSKTRSVFGQANPTPLEVGIDRMARWALEVGPRSSSPYKDLEVSRGLPDAWRRDED